MRLGDPFNQFDSTAYYARQSDDFKRPALCSEMCKVVPKLVKPPKVASQFIAIFCQLLL